MDKPTPPQTPLFRDFRTAFGDHLCDDVILIIWQIVRENNERISAEMKEGWCGWRHGMHELNKCFRAFRHNFVRGKIMDAGVLEHIDYDTWLEADLMQTTAAAKKTPFERTSQVLFKRFPKLYIAAVEYARALVPKYEYNSTVLNVVRYDFVCSNIAAFTAMAIEMKEAYAELFIS